MKTKLTSLTLAAAFLALLCATSVSLQAATITVTTTNDSGAGSLRTALAGAANGDTINFSVTGTITLTNGQLNVSNSVSLLGPGPGTLTVSGNHASRVFSVTGTNVTFSGLTIANGQSGINNGGGICLNSGVTMTVSNCIVSGNCATNYDEGGGIYNYYGNLTVVGSTMSGNSAWWGGGIYNYYGNLTVVDSTLTGNSAFNSGGAIYSANMLTVIHSALSGNSATNWGGGIVNDGSSGSANLTITNSTLSGNSAGCGGGIYNGGEFGSVTLTIANTTISSNLASSFGAGIYNDGSSYGMAALTITNTTVGGNWAGTNGGGICNDGSSYGTGMVMVATSVIRANAANNSGGGIMNDGSTGSALLTITGSTVSTNSAYLGAGVFSDGQSGSAKLTNNASTFSGNSASYGGGIYNFAGGAGGSVTLTINASTFSGNGATYQGGGIYNDGQSSGNATLTINASTFSGNWATNGGGSIYNYGILGGNARLEIGDTILNAAAGVSITNVQGTVKSDGFNLSNDAGGGCLTNATDHINISNLLLGPLQDNGGPTWTHALLPGSPAIDQGKRNAVTNLVWTTDQRGLTRPVDFLTVPNAPGGDGSDIGAFELQYSPVVSTADNGPGTLRNALADVANGGTITFGVAGTITLTNGQLNVSNSVTLLGPGPGALTVSGNNASGVFNITGTNVTISGLTITNGNTSLNGAGINAGGAPGSTLAIDNCVVVSNLTTSAGGGGGIYNSPGVTMTISNCTLSLNRASSGFGGGIFNDRATLIVVGSTLSANYGTLGGGIGNNGSAGTAILMVKATTLSGNSSYLGGGGILNWGQSGSATLTINASTFSGNSATGSGGGSICNNGSLGTGRVEVADCILSAGAVGGNIYNYQGTVTSAGYNLSSDNGGGFLTATGDQINTNPLLGPLQNNGGPTWTCALLPGSPAIDKGKTNAIPGLACSTDQRGFPRPCDNPNLANAPGGDGSDIGAYEAQYIVVSNAADSGPGSLRAAVANYVSGDSIAFAPSLSGATILLTSGQITLNQSLTIDASALPGGITINGNQASRIFQVGGGVTVVLNSLTITNGTDTGGGNAGGGGILSYGTLTLNNCTLAGNSANQSTWGGGGILSYHGTLTINQSTLSGNSANNGTSGGGIITYSGTLTINQSTVSGNSAAGNGGGIRNGGTMTVNNSIVAGNSPDNISGSFTGANNLTSGDPLLAPLGNYGGPTPTMPPLPGSPAIDGCTNGTVFTTDQRGFPRVVGPFADIGAVESGNPIPCLMVNTAVDKNDGLGTDGASLRDAVAYAPSGSTIIFAPALSGVTIVLTNGQLNVPNSVTILGPGPGALTVSGNNASGVFNVTGTNVTISGLTIANGSADYGAGIYAGGDAGSIVTINNCVLTNNSATGNGGGVYTISGVTMTISHCTFSGNNAPAGSGGGIYNDGTSGSSAAVTISASTFSGNSAGFGGGIYSDGSQGGSVALTISASTFSGNSATFTGGGIYNCGFFGNATLTISASTFSGNSASAAAGGIYNLGSSGNATLEIGDTILNTGSSGENIVNASGTVTSDGYNLSSDNGGSFLNATGDQINTDPKLGPLQDNGGPTRTHALLAGSPAIDAGADSVTNFLATDQRGYPRCSGAHVDIGAVEAQWAPANHPPRLSNSAWTAPGGARCFQCTFSSVTNADFTVLATTNLALPLPDWTMLAPAIQYSPGQYQFTDPGATNYPQRFYRVVSP